MKVKPVVTAFAIAFVAAYAFAVANKKIGGLPGLK